MYSMLDLFAGAGGMQKYPATLEDFNVDDEQCINSVFCDWIFDVYRDGIDDVQMRNIFDDVYHIASQIVSQKRPYHKYEEYLVRAGNCIFEKSEEGRTAYRADTKRMRTVFSLVYCLLSFHAYESKFRIKQVMDRLMEQLMPHFNYEVMRLNSMVRTQNASLLTKKAMMHSATSTGSTMSIEEFPDDQRRFIEMAYAFQQAEEAWLAEKRLLQAEVDKAHKEAEDKTMEAIGRIVEAIVEVGEEYPSSSNDKAEVIRSLLLEKAVYGHIPAEALTDGIRNRINALGRKESPLQIGTMKVENLNDIHDNKTVNYGSKG